MAFSKTLKEKKLIIQCDSCFREITLDPFIKCAECAWDQCLPCFFANMETAQHKITHSYRLVTNMEKPLITDEWRTIDELQLLHGVITFGIGNFEDIASILSSKTGEEVKEHFFTLFNIPNSQEGEEPRGITQKSDPNDSLVLSYMPKRKDFESEIINNYEMVISNLQFSESDTSIERQLKKHMLDNYLVVLRQRRMWKNYILDRNFTEVNKIKENETGKAKAIINNYKWLAQYLSKNDFNFFIGRIVRENYLKDLMSTGRTLKQPIDEAKLLNMSGILGDAEKELCKRLNMPLGVYSKVKRFAIECYICKKPLKRTLALLFDSKDKDRVDILYNWFKNQNVDI